MSDPTSTHRPVEADEFAEVDMSDEDILASMKKIPGYLDITTADFRALYQLAHAEAVERLFGPIRADRLMRRDVEPLAPEMSLEQAARIMVRDGMLALPVSGADGVVIGMLTETDFFRLLQVGSFLEMILRLVDDSSAFSHAFHDTPVRAAMAAPAVTLAEDAGFRQIVAAFHAHEGRATPVVDGSGVLRGLLLRRDFLQACRHLGAA